MVRRLLANDWFLVGVVVVAAVLRLAHLHALRSTVYFENLDLDPQSFDLWAQRIAAGEWPGDSPFFVDPLYSYVLGGLYSVFGRSLLLVRVLQAGLGVGTCLIVALIGRRLLGAALGNAAALVLALYRPAVFYDGELEKTTLSMFLFAAAVLALLRPTARSRLLAGVLLALAGLARGHLLVLAPFITGWLLLERPGWGRAAWRMPACFAVAFLAVLAPVVAHNHRAGGGWAVTTSAGQNLYIGNNPLNEGGSYCYLPFVRANALFEEEDFHAEAETRVGRPLDAAAVSRFWADEALAHVRAHPGPAARMLARKAVPAAQRLRAARQSGYVLPRARLLGPARPAADLRLAARARARGHGGHVAPPRRATPGFPLRRVRTVGDPVLRPVTLPGAARPPPGHLRGRRGGWLPASAAVSVGPPCWRCSWSGGPCRRFGARSIRRPRSALP
jgi:hypothetical protein